MMEKNLMSDKHPTRLVREIVGSEAPRLTLWCKGRTVFGRDIAIHVGYARDRAVYRAECCRSSMVRCGGYQICNGCGK